MFNRFLEFVFDRKWPLSWWIAVVLWIGCWVVGGLVFIAIDHPEQHVQHAVIGDSPVN